MKPMHLIATLSLMMVLATIKATTPATADTSSPLFSGQLQLYVPPESTPLQHFDTLAVIPAPAEITPSPLCGFSPNELALGGIRDGAMVYDMDKEQITGRIFIIEGECRRTTVAAMTFMPTGKVDYVDGTSFEVRFQALEDELWRMMETELSPDEMEAYKTAFYTTCADNACDVFDRLRKTFTFLTVTEILP